MNEQNTRKRCKSVTRQCLLSWCITPPPVHAHTFALCLFLYIHSVSCLYAPRVSCLDVVNSCCIMAVGSWKIWMSQRKHRQVCFRLRPNSQTNLPFRASHQTADAMWTNLQTEARLLRDHHNPAWEQTYHFIIEFWDNGFLWHGAGVRLEQLQQMVQGHLGCTQAQIQINIG